MKGKYSCLILAICLVVVGGMTTPAAATLLTINNPSFEYPEVAHGSGSATVDFWDKTGVGGIWHYKALPPDGVQVAFLSGGTLSQTLGYAVQQGDYTLTASVRKYFSDNNQQFRLQLYAVTGTGDGQLLSEVYGVPAGTKQWDQVSFTFHDTGQYVGAPLKIVLRGSTSELDFDMVTLDFVAAPVPIPPTALLVGSGLLGIVFFRGRRRKSSRKGFLL